MSRFGKEVQTLMTIHRRDCFFTTSKAFVLASNYNRLNRYDLDKRSDITIDRVWEPTVLSLTWSDGVQYSLMVSDCHTDLHRSVGSVRNQ
jgi:hypothetical protein